MTESKEYKFSGTGLTQGEKRWANNQFNSYRDRYHIDNFSDLEILSELVFREALQQRSKKKIEKYGEKAKGKKEGAVTKKETNTVIPQHLLSFLDENLERILTLKEKLGLFSDKTTDPFQHIQTLKKKFKKWMSENQGSRTLICPHCSNMVMLKIRTDKYEAQKHPFFVDKILANKHLWKMYKDGTITKEDVAKVLGTSDMYINWLEERIYNKDSENPSK